MYERVQYVVGDWGSNPKQVCLESYLGLFNGVYSKEKNS